MRCEVVAGGMRWYEEDECRHGEAGEGASKQVDTLTKNDMRILAPSFHIANIQNLLTKTESGEKGMFVKQLDKINFLRDQCKDENPYFLALAETWIKDGILESEYMK